MRLAFVPPRFGDGVLGGSEAVVREAALGLAGRGHEVEVLTTCALDHFTWANELPAGTSVEDGVTVRRFPTARHPSRAALAAQLSVQRGQVPDLDHQVSWLGFHFSAPELFEHLLRHQDLYDAIVFSPYLFWTASACVPWAADKAVVIPCLHDEAYARLDVLRPVLAAPALAWFLTEPEHRLAHRLGPVAPAHLVTGAGVPVPSSYDPEGFRARHGLDRPFVLYAGRKEEDKGVPALLGAFARAVKEGRAGFDLVMIGKGEAAVPPAAAGRVADLGYLPDPERNDAFAAAAAYVQPSPNESFSRTVMEAWLAGTPVVALAGSEVVAWHLGRSGGGFSCSRPDELMGRLQELVDDPARAAVLAARGRQYVLGNYSWPAVLDRMEASLRATFSRPRPAGGPAVAAPAGPGAGAGPGAPLPRRPLPRRLVAGSYPPVPGEPSAATVAAVRRGWAEGRQVVVVSPRPSAAHLVARLAGPAAGRRLARLARELATDEVVACLEPGMPFRPGRWGARRTARSLAGALGGCRWAEVVVTGDLGVPPAALARLWPAVGAVTASSAEAARWLEASGARGVRVAEPGPGDRPALEPAAQGPSPGPFEPGDLLLRRRALRLVGAVARRLLGRHAVSVRRRLQRLRLLASRT